MTLLREIQTLLERTYAPVAINLESCVIGESRCATLNRLAGEFFRALPGFVVQFGMNAKPAVEAVWQKANIRDDAVKQSNKKGYVVFATAGPNTRTTQIFINLGDNSQLDSQGFAPFGMVVEGMDVVEKFYNGYGDPPRGPDQGRIAAEGKAYLDKNFPQLDSIKTAKIVGEPATAKPAATTKPATTTKPAPAKTTN